MPCEGEAGRLLRKSAFAQTGIDSRELAYALMPFWRRFGDITFYQGWTKLESDARTLFEVLLGDVAVGPGGGALPDQFSWIASARMRSFVDEDILGGKLIADARAALRRRTTDPLFEIARGLAESRGADPQ
jgi:hypothetical protein